MYIGRRLPDFGIGGPQSRLLGGLIALALNGAGKDELLGGTPPALAEFWRKEPLSPHIQEIADGSYRSKDPPEIRGTGYVVESLEAGLWALHRAESFREGALLAVNLGDDADTVVSL